MRDKRPVDELSIEELERILAIRKREERQRQLQRMQRSGRVIPQQAEEKPKAQPVVVVEEKPKNSDAPALVQYAAAAAAATTTSPHFEDDLEDTDYTPRGAEDGN